MELGNTQLGKATNYHNQYSPGLLCPLPRRIPAPAAGVPFYGADIWNSYELSWLNSKGKPISSLATFSFPCTSPNLIESKSFKLYLNSLSGTTFESVDDVRGVLVRDLSNASGSDVDIEIRLLQELTGETISTFSGLCIDNVEVACNAYTPDASLLSSGDDFAQEDLYSNLLKSNCPVTGQPDWASVQISYTGPQIAHAGLLQYIVSYRNYSDFHEHCVEQIFSDIMRHCKPERLSVYARYTRRGGLDINPHRSSYDTVFSNTRHIRQ